MKKVIAFLLTIIMIFTLCSTAFAYDKEVFLVLGDSIGYGYGLKDNTKYSYGALISEANDYTYLNFAQNGDTTYDLNNKLTANSSVIAAVNSADIIAVSIGGNNFLHDNVVAMAVTGLFGNYNRINKTAQEFYENFCLVVDNIRAINPEAELLVQTLYNPQTGLLQGVYQYGVDNMNSKIKLAAAEKDFTVVEVAAAFEGKADEYIQNDIIHPNELGHYAIAQEYLKVLKEMSLGTADEPVTDKAEVEIYSLIDKILDFFRNLFSFNFI